MRKLTFVLAAAASVSVLAAPAFAHPEDEFGSYQPRGPSTGELAQEAINKLVAQKKLPATWTGARLVSFDYRSKNGVEQYVVTFENPAIKQASKRKLYVLMSTSGSFISASHKLS
jgi:hypothetical protein